MVTIFCFVCMFLCVCVCVTPVCRLVTTAIRSGPRAKIVQNTYDKQYFVRTSMVPLLLCVLHLLSVCID